MMIKYFENHPATGVLIVCGALFFPYLEVQHVTIMEARNFVTAREMIFDSHWLFTTMNGVPRYAKPPLPTWLTAWSGILLGIKNLFALRLPAALSATLMVWVIYRFSSHIKGDKKFGVLTGLVLATSFYVVFSGRSGQWDIFAHSFMLAGLYFLFQFLVSSKNIWKNVILAGIFAGCSFLSKGPVSWYALFFPFLIAYGVVYRFPNIKTRWFPVLIFLLLAISIGFSWYLYVRIADPVTFLTIARKEALNWSNYNTRPFYYYWSFFLQSGVWTVPAFISILYPYMKNRVTHVKAYQFALLWTLCSVLLLSLIPEKKSRYLLPVLLPLAVNTAFYIEYLLGNFRALKSKIETYPVYAYFGSIAITGIAFPIVAYALFAEKLSGLWSYFILISFVLMGIGIMMLIQLKKKNIHHVFLLTIGFMMSIMLFGFPLSKIFYTNTAFRNVDTLYEYVGKNNLKVYAFSDIGPEMLWHYGRTVPLIRKENKTHIPLEDTFGVLVTPDDEAAFKTAFVSVASIGLETVFDLNYGKNQKNRLIGKFYIVKK